MRMYDIIDKKKKGGVLSAGEISFAVSGYTDGSIPDYQMAALLMTMCMGGMTDEETFAMTDAMLRSGETVDLSSIPGSKIDKHSSGGVGDKTTFIVCPILAALGVPVAKMSGRGLGSTGGTIDKLESVPGVRTNISEDEFIDIVRRTGFADIACSKDIVPADKKIYALRDVTAMVDSIGLIASSIMSKKLASGADGIVLDVKCGTGAFMKDEKEAERLTGLMVRIGRNAGRRMTALITDMNEPLGRYVGNAIEMNEVFSALAGQGEERLMEVSMRLAEEMLLLSDFEAGADGSIRLERIRKAISGAISSGDALRKLTGFIVSVGGRIPLMDESEAPKEYAERIKLPAGSFKMDIRASESGYMTFTDCGKVGDAASMLGAGRNSLGDRIDPGAGIGVYKKSGDRVDKGEKVFTLFSESESSLKDAGEAVRQSFEIRKDSPGKRPAVISAIR